MTSLLHPPQAISSKWKEKYGIEQLPDTVIYPNDVDSTLSYFELKKILQIQQQLMLRLKDEQDPIKMQVMQQRFLALRLAEKDILKRHGTVVYEAKKHKA
jgi:hypothetical protein